MSVEDLTTWTLQNSESVLSVSPTTLTFTGINAGLSVVDQIYKDRGAGFYTGSFTHRAGPINFSAASSNNSRLTMLAVAMAPEDPANIQQGCMAAVWLNTATNPTVYLVEMNSINTGNVPDNATTVASYQNAAVGLSTNFWIELSRTGTTTATLKIYSDAYTTLLQTLTFTLSQGLSYEYVYIGKASGSSGATVSGTLQNVDLSPGGGSNTAITPTVGSDNVTGNTPTVTSATNTNLVPITAERRPEVTAIPYRCAA